MADEDRLLDRAMQEFLARAQFALPDRLADLANSVLVPLRMRMTVYFVDHEQRQLQAVPEPGLPALPPISVDGTMAGRAFSLIQPIRAAETGHAKATAEHAQDQATAEHAQSTTAETGHAKATAEHAQDHATAEHGQDQATAEDGPGSGRWWLPLVDDTERLGVVELSVDGQAPWANPVPPAERFASLLAHLLATKLPYGDVLHRVRRARSMSASGELLLAMLPPLTFSCADLVVSAILEPAYEVGGDAFDYAVQTGLARFAVLDAMGRGLQAATTSVTAMSAMRAARRNEQALIGIAAAADAALVECFGDMRFATCLLAELDTDTGSLRYLNAGHPPPVLMRRHHAVTELDGARRLPLGLGGTPVEYAEVSLEPGDRLLLYTDGVVEARDTEGNLFGVPRLIDMAERGAAARLPAPETLRRLSHAVLDHQGGPPADDATLMLIEWAPDGGL